MQPAGIVVDSWLSLGSKNNSSCSSGKSSVSPLERNLELQNVRE